MNLLVELNTLAFHLAALLSAFSVWVLSWFWHDYLVVKTWLRWTNMSLQQAQAIHAGSCSCTTATRRSRKPQHQVIHLAGWEHTGLLSVA